MIIFHITKQLNRTKTSKNYRDIQISWCASCFPFAPSVYIASHMKLLPSILRTHLHKLFNLYIPTTSLKLGYFHNSNMNVHATNAQAQFFKSLHVPGRPLLLANIHDPSTARIVASLPGCKALATASASLSLVNNTDDDNLSLEAQLAAVRDIAAVARETGKPLTVDLQDGYGERLEEAVRGMIALGVVGINLEDSDQKTHAMTDEVVAVQRIKRALAAAAEVGVPDFVVNARSDSFLRGGALDESIRRGKLYLDAGATTIYILNGSQRLTREDVKKIVDSLQGRVNIALRLPKPDTATDTLSSKDLTDLGVARVSIGPQLYFVAMEATKRAAAKVFEVDGANI